MSETKPFTISKHLVMQAFRLVKGNQGSSGIDQQSIVAFEENLQDNLYKLWNRMSSGTYFPPPVKAVPISKKSGGERLLGIPTVTDRIAQMVVKLLFEPQVEQIFLPDSYGYRPNKSALDAIGVTRKRCWRYPWVLEFDIQGLFDNLDHALMMKAVRKHTNCKWIILYIERWLKTPMQLPDGSLQEKSKGIMQGGVISPVLSNLFLHYVFDYWMTKHFPEIPWCRYSDDGLMHCKTQYQAQRLKSSLVKRFKECGLDLHPDKTKIVYCKMKDRKETYSNTQFNFLGYTFRTRWVKKREDNSLFLSFTPAVSKISLMAMRRRIRLAGYKRKTNMELEEIAAEFNPVLRGWINYYGRFNQQSLYPLLGYFNSILWKWAMRKFKKLSISKKKAYVFIASIARKRPNLFAHWKIGATMFA